MAKNLDWFQARALARTQMKRVRRDAWRKWLEFDRGVYLWFIYQPPGQTKIVAGVENAIAESRHVVMAAEFVAAEFLAQDWTDEGWTVVTPPIPPIPPSDGGGDPPVVGEGGGGSDGDSDADDPEDEDGPNDDPGGGAGGGGGGGGKPEIPPPNPPPPPVDNSGGFGSDVGGSGSWGGGGSGGGGSGGGGGKNPPKRPPPQADYTPGLDLSFAADVDGPGCFIVVPDQGTILVSITVPNPQGGTANVLGLSVTCLGQTQLQTVGPGASTGFTFTGPIGPDGTVRVTVTVRDFNGHSWTASATIKWPPRCLLPIFTWAGSKTVTHRCNHGSGGQDGYDVVGHYMTRAQYAVHPAAGTGKAGTNTGADFNPEHNRIETTTPYPAGSPTTVESFVAAPGGITCDVSSDGAINNVSPNSLNLYPPSVVTTTGTPPNTCTNTVVASESGPNGSE